MEPKCIYFDNAATTKVDPEVAEEIKPCLGELYGNPSTNYQLGHEANEAILIAKEKLGYLIGSEPWNIFFTSCGTESNNWAILAPLLDGSPKRHIITSAFEHHAVLHPVNFATSKLGATATIVGCGSDGLVDPDEIRRAIRPDTYMISIMFVNNEIGTIQPIPEIAKIARDHGVLLHVDGVQALGKVPIDVSEVPIDLLSLSGHKIYAPKGVGALFIREGLKFPPYLHGGKQEGGKRAGTQNLPGIVGFGKAAELTCLRMEEDNSKVAKMAQDLLIKIQESIPGVTVNGSLSHRVGSNLNLRIKGVTGEKVKTLLGKLGVYIATGSACNCDDPQPSHVLVSIGLSPEEALSSIRITLGRFNTPEEIPIFLEALSEVVTTLRGQKI